MSLCIGRFALDVPAALDVDARSQSIYGVDMRTAAMYGAAFDGIWGEALRRIHALPAPAGSQHALVRTLDLLPGVPGAWYFDDPGEPRWVALTAMKPVEDQLLLVLAHAEVTQQKHVEQVAKIAINAYVPGTEHGFCVGAGAITSVPGEAEQTSLTLSSRSAPGLLFKLETQSVQAPGSQTSADLDEEASAASQSGGHLMVERNAERTVAGLQGREIRISLFTPADGASVRFTWFFPGQPARCDRPMVNLVATAPRDRQAELAELWEQAVPTIRQVLLSPNYAPAPKRGW